MIVPLEMAGGRLDIVLVKLMSDYSRSRLSLWIRGGAVTVNDEPTQSKDKIIGGELTVVTARPNKEDLALMPEPMDLDIIYEDDIIIVINKPVGLVIHPASGDWSGTPFNSLSAHCPELSRVPRAGIVYRSDKEASGLMVVAKTLPMQNSLVQQLQERAVKRIYHVIANGIIPFDGKIETRIGRDLHNRLKMAIVKFGGKPVITHVKILERHLVHSYTECLLGTSYTHQIRVHMREANYPLVADPVYDSLCYPCGDIVKGAIKALGACQALHTYCLSFVHPKTGETVSFEASMPDDTYHLLSVLRLGVGLGSSLSNEGEWQEKFGTDGGDDQNEGDYDVEIVYVGD